MNVELDPQDKKRVEELSRETGKDPRELLRELVHQALESRTQDDHTASDEQEAAWKHFLTSTAAWSKNLPPGYRVDDSRESIHAGRGE